MLLMLVLVGLLAVPAFSQEKSYSHRFFDRENKIAFAGVFAGRALDCASTWNFRSRGYNEIFLTNRFVDNKPAFLGYSFGMAGLNVAGAYLLHRTHHHRLERALSYIHIGGEAATVLSNYRLGK